ncbi:hypothetical protein [Demequina sp. NBRC 110054]|uniref:hypothetical protein n=1 Tax=Demequina sp. NBRC 110054 TaxID=1570343 RepID=UPI00135669EE|nr:hypothetical protein [Demequina sp. NBRC 110054]
MSDTRGASQPTPEEAADGEARRVSLPVPAGSMAPEPIEGDEGEVIPAVTPPGDDEILPTTGSIPFAPVAGRPVSPYESRGNGDDATTDDVQLLGSTAVTNASREASGAPTASLPAGWLRPAGSGPAPASPPAPAFGDDEIPFTPRFEPRTIFAPVALSDAPDEADDDRAPEAAEGPADATAASAGPRTADLPMMAAFAGADPLEEPGERRDADGPTVTEVPTDDASPTEPSSDEHGPASSDGDSPTRPRASIVVIILLVLAGLVVWAGAAYGAVAALSPDPVVVDGEIRVAGPDGPTISPIELTDTTDFLAAIPLTAGVFALTNAETLDPEESDLPQEAAEAYDLQYSDGTDIIDVLAIQHYKAGKAKKAYNTLSKGGEDLGGVEDSTGEVVGAAAVIDDGDASTVVWRNGTAVFVATGDHDQLLELYRLYGL